MTGLKLALAPPRASELYIISNCDAAWGLIRKSGEEPATSFAQKGTRIHRVLAASGSMGDLDPDEHKTFEELWNKFREMVRTWREGAPVDNVWNEHEFSFVHEAQVILTGHPDKVIKSGSKAFIPDFKTGWHTLDAISATNAQLRGYVVLASANIPGLEEITVWIDKPGKTDPPALYDKDAIEAAKEWVIETVNRVTSVEAQLKPTRGEWCQYCAGKVICPLWRGEIEMLAEATNDLVEEMPDHQLALIAPKLDIARKVIDRLKARLESRVRANPNFFADWHFKPGRADPEIQSVEKAWLAMKGTLEAPVFLEATKIGIGKLVELYREATKTTWDDARAAVEKKLGDNLKYSRAKPSLVYDPKARTIRESTEGEQHGD
jgi:hypothetical protein